MEKKVNTPKKGAGRKWAARLEEFGKKRPPKDLMEKINHDDQKKVALPITPKKGLDL